MCARRVSRRVVLLGTAVALAGCEADRAGVPADRTGTAAAMSPKPETTGRAAHHRVRRVDVDPAAVKANELGLVPVMMYHRITRSPDGPFDTTVRDFRAGLQRMFSGGYRPVRTIDLARGRLAVPAGMTPVVLTFDDGHPSQLRILPDGRVDPRCAVGVLLEVCAQFPDCPPAGSFNINANPFGLIDPAARGHALRVLHQLGFEVANHTFGHDNLAQLDATAVQRDFVLLQRLVARAVGDVSVRTVALPFGLSPRNPALCRSGRWDGESYRNEATLLVGANPCPSPFSVRFDPQQVPRIRVTSWDGGRMPLTARYWLDYLDAHPRQRYISAGNPSAITFPKAAGAQLARHYLHQATPY